MSNQGTRTTAPLRSVVVKLLVYSGRPDPTWALKASRVSELQSKVAEVLKGSPVHPPPLGGLGYRGFRIRAALQGGGDAAALPEDLAVFRNVVSVLGHTRSTHFIDAADVETWLLATAIAEGHKPLLEKFGAPDLTEAIRIKGTWAPEP
jgi:hypothetical protein